MLRLFGENPNFDKQGIYHFKWYYERLKDLVEDQVIAIEKIPAILPILNLGKENRDYTVKYKGLIHDKDKIPWLEFREQENEMNKNNLKLNKKQQLIEKWNKLSSDKQQEVIEFIDSLIEQRKERSYGLCEGEFTVPDDFDEPLSPEKVIGKLEELEDLNLGEEAKIALSQSAMVGTKEFTDTLKKLAEDSIENAKKSGN